MSQSKSIFSRNRRVVLPERETPLMRVLEPRVLLDAAALETALDVAAQAVHSDLAEAYLSPEAQARPIAERTPFAVHRSAAFEGLHDIVREDAEIVADVVPEDRRTEIVFIDGSLPQREALVEAVDPNAEVYVIDVDADGLAYMAQTLTGRSDVDAIHILSHGSAGSLQLGASSFDAARMSDADRRSLATVRDALSEDADLLIYGCRFGDGAEGRRAAAALALATGADVAASDDLTGSAALGGDWDLELRVGDIEAATLSATAFDAVLDDEYAIAIVSDPIITHPSGGVPGTFETVVRYEDAVTFTPDGGGPAVTYDLVGQFVGQTGDVTVAFTQVGDDLGITVNNAGPIDPDTGLAAPGAVAIVWNIQDPGTLSQTPLGAIDLVVDNLFGAGGVPDSGTGVSVGLGGVSSYTLDPATHIEPIVQPAYSVSGDGTLLLFGTEPADPSGDTDQVAIRWDRTASLVMSFHTREATSTFVVDGDRDTGFATGVRNDTRYIDANGDAPGRDHSAVYVNAGGAPGDEAGVAIVDAETIVYDIDDRTLRAMRIVIDNASVGDTLVFDSAAAADLGLNVTLTDSGGQVRLDVVADDTQFGAPIEQFRDFLRSVTYRNDLPNTTFDRTTPRTILTSFDDGYGFTPAATTTVTFIDAPDTVTAPPLLETAQEDASIVRNAGTGLLSRIANPAGNTGIAVDAISIDGTNIPLGQAFTTPAGATLTVAADGSFSYVPLADRSGSETFEVTIADGAGGTVVTSLILASTAEPDAPTLTLTLPTASTNEDTPTAALNIVATSNDPSETFQVRIENLPRDVIVEDQQGNSVRSNPDEEPFIDVTGWNLETLRILPVEDSDLEITFDVIARSTEGDGRFAEVSQEVTYTIDAVADVPELIVRSAIAPVDGVVELFRFIDVSLRDVDGSESIGQFVVSGISSADQTTFFVANQPRTVDYSAGPDDGVLVLTPTDLQTLVMTGPNDGEQHSYRYFVTVQAVEAAPNGDVAVGIATTEPIALNIALDSSDDPVEAFPDTFTARAGDTTTIDVLDNDVGLDGGLEVFAINGTPIDVDTPYTLPNGAGVLSLSARSELIFAGAPDFSGTVTFDYSMRDFDYDEDTTTVVLDVEPAWGIASDGLLAVEGGTAEIAITLAGSLRPGETASVEPTILYETALPVDLEPFADAINAAVATTPGFSFDGTRLSFETPIASYTTDVETGVTFADIAATGTALDVTSGSASLALDFPFVFNGQTVTAVDVMPHGLVSIGGPQGSFANGALDGSALDGASVIAPWWDAIEAGTASVTTATEGVVGARETTIQWVGTPAGGTETVTFQAVLFEANGTIEFRYLDVAAGSASSGGGTATIGLQGDGIGTQFSRDNASVADGTRVRFDAPVTVAPQLDISWSVVDDTLFEPQETLRLQLENALGSQISDGRENIVIEYSDNTAPVANDDSAVTPKNEPVTIDVIGGAGADTDAESQPLTITEIEGTAVIVGDVVTLTSGATVTLEADGTLTYDPNGQFDTLLGGGSAPDGFSYTISDGLDGVATANVTVDVQGVNVPPSVGLGGAGTTNVSFTYLDTQSRVTVAPSAVVSDTEGEDFPSLVIEIAGFIQGDVEELIFGSTVLQASVALTAPVVVDGNTFDLVYDGASTITITGAGGTAIPNGAAEGLIRSVTYDNTDATDLEGERTLTFALSDPSGTSPLATVTIDVRGSNRRPVAVDDGSVASPFAIGTEDTPLAIDPNALLANDSDFEGDDFSIVGYGNETGGEIVIDATGAVSFVPDADHEGTATFDYTIRDDFGGLATATVTLDFAGVNDAPTVDLNPDPGSTGVATSHTEGGAATPIFSADGVLADVDDTALQAATVSFSGAVGDRIVVGTLPAGISPTFSPAALETGLTAAGAATITLTGTATVAQYEAALAALAFETVSDQPDTTPRTFAIAVFDGSLMSASAENVMQVVATNDAPEPTDDGLFTMAEDGELRLPIATLLQNDTDPDGTRPTFAGITSVTGGTAVVDGAEIVFTPDADASGPASFTYAVSDGVAADVEATVSIDVLPINDAPVLDTDGTTASVENTISLTFDEDAAPLTLLGTDFALTDVDDTEIEVAVVTLRNGQPGDTLIYDPVPAGTTVSLSPAGPLGSATAQTLTLVGAADTAEYRDWLASVRYQNTSQAPSELVREISFQVSDGSLPSNIVTVNVAVVASNDAPDAVADPVQTVAEDGELRIAPTTLMANDVDPDGEVPIFDGVSNAVGGTVTIDATGTVVFTPDADTFGAASFDYTIRDADGETDTQTVSVDIAPVNDAPTLSHDASPGTLVVSYTEGDRPVPLVTGFSVGDIDSAQISSVEVMVANGAPGDVVASTTTVPGITVTAPTALANAGPIFVTLTGPADAAAFDAAVAALTFASTSDFPSEVPRDVTIRASDGSAVSDPVSIRVEVTEVNDLPDAPALAPFATVEDTPVSIPFVDLTGGFVDRDGDPLVVSAIGTVIGGTATLGTGVVTFTPDPDYDGPASFGYTIADGRGGTIDHTADIVIQPVDDAPVVTLGAAVGPYIENGTAIPLLDPALSVSDVDSALLDSALVQIVGQAGDVVSHDLLPSGISVVVDPSSPLAQPGTIIVEITGAASAADYEAALRALRFSSVSESPNETPRAVQIAVQDATSASAIVASSLTVQAVNDVPVAGPDPQLVVAEDTPLAVSDAVLLADVIDADGDTLIVTGTSNVTGGTLVAGPGGYTFTPDADYFGAAGFDYEVSDGNGGVITAHADIDVTPVDDAPTLDLSGSTAGIDYVFTFTEDDAPTPIVGSDILVDDVDTAQLVSATITLTNGQAGDELLVGTLPAAISASVVPSGPLAASGTITIYLTGPEIPTVYGFALGAISYSTESQSPVETPRIVEISVGDGTSSSAVARTQIDVVSVNDAPVAEDDGVAPALSTLEDTPIQFQPIANDTDADGDPLFVTAIAGTPVVAGGTVTVADGRVTLLADGRTMQFEPRAHYFGTASFGYTVSDSQATADADVTIEVVSVNDVPVLGVDDPVTLDEDTSAAIDPTANDTDADGDPLRIASLNGVAAAPGTAVTLPEGEVRVGIDGRTITFTPAPNWNGVLSVPYEVTDGEGATVAAELVFDVAPVNDPLQIVSQPPAVTFDDGATVSLPMDSYLTDPDGDPITYSATGLPAGLAIDPATGLISGRLASEASATSPYAITVRGNDGMGSTLDVTFQLTAVNLVPIAAPDTTVGVADGDIVSYPAADLFTDPDGDVLTYSAFGLPAWLQLDAQTGELFGVVPFDASQSGPVVFSVVATDHAGASDTVAVTFAPTNPAPVVLRPLTIMVSDEGLSVERDLTAFIGDGGMDGDTLTWTVSGLPDGVTFDPATAVISGTPAEGTRSQTGYEIAVTADDGQGGTLSTTFTFYVGDTNPVRPPFVPTLDPQDTGDADDGDIFVGGSGPTALRPLGVAARETLDTSATVAVDRERGIVGTAVSGVRDLASIDDVATDLDDFDRRVRATLRGDILPVPHGAGGVEPLHVDRSVTVRENPDGSIESAPVDAFALPTDAGDDPLVVEVPEAFREAAADADPIRVSARVAPGRVFVEARDVAVSGDPVRPVSITARGMIDAVTQKIVRNGMVAFGIPSGLLDLSVTVAVELADDVLAVRDYDVDARTGEVTPVLPSNDGGAADVGAKMQRTAAAPTAPSVL